MTQSKHTPGPWVAEVYEHGEFEIEAHGQGSSGGLLVICSRNKHQGRPYEFEANARLIAAAPKMYELLKRYYQETPLGNQPHMIADVVEELLSQIDGA